MTETLLRHYDLGPFNSEGYPMAWDKIKVLVREQAGNRCVRCHHPYSKGEGEWSRCDDKCSHGGPMRVWATELERVFASHDDAPWIWQRHLFVMPGSMVRQARWRILTTHHLDGDKANCRWWNLAPLCQRCHLSIQSRVVMDRIYDKPHTPWFMPYAAGFYAFKYLGEDLSRDEVEQRMEELLLLELRQLPLFEGVMES